MKNPCIKKVCFCNLLYYGPTFKTINTIKKTGIQKADTL